MLKWMHGATMLPNQCENPVLPRRNKLKTFNIRYELGTSICHLSKIINAYTAALAYPPLCKRAVTIEAT
jgi:hypothetical protein